LLSCKVASVAEQGIKTIGQHFIVGPTPEEVLRGEYILLIPKGKRVVVLSEGGGDNAITVDKVEMQGLEVNVLGGEVQEKLKPFILEGLKPCNPIDYGGKAEENPHQIIPACCEICMEDNSVDIIITTGFFGGFKDIIAPRVEEFEKETSRKVVELVKKTKNLCPIN